MKNLIFVLIAVIVTVGCQKDPIPWKNQHSLIFEPGNDSTYIFADFHPDTISKGTAGITIKNGQTLGGGIRYTFENRNDSVFVKAHHPVMSVTYYFKATGKNTGRIIPMESGTFAEYYPNHLHNLGHFIVEIPWND